MTTKLHPHYPMLVETEVCTDIPRALANCPNLGFYYALRDLCREIGLPDNGSIEVMRVILAATEELRRWKRTSARDTAYIASIHRQLGAGDIKTARRILCQARKESQ